MNTTQSSFSTRLKVGGFALIGIALIVFFSFATNGHPYWWRSCQLVNVNVEDATGLKSKSAVRSLGIEIGYLKSVALADSHVTLGLCVTAPVEILPATRAYIRGEGFLGDKFVELKPVRYVMPGSPSGTSSQDSKDKGIKSSYLHFFLSEARADESHGQETQNSSSKSAREIPVGEQTEDVQHLVNRVDDLVQQISGLTDNLKLTLNPSELQSTMRQLNRTLENASRTLSPESGLNQTAQRTLAKLEDAIDQLRDIMVRVNKGEGSVGKLLNDPVYAEEIHTAIQNINKLLNRVANVRFHLDVGATFVTAYNGGRGWFQLGIWPKKDRYYLLGIAVDPRGRISNQTVTTTSGGLTTVTQTQVVDPSSILFTVMLGKVFLDHRLDLSAGALYGDGAGSVIYNLGPLGEEEKINFRADVYFRSSVGAIDSRLTLNYQPFGGVLHNFYLRCGIESFRPYQGIFPALLLGGGLSFDDEDIKVLFSLR